METKLIEQNAYKVVVEALKKGEVVAFPTETVYGLGVIFDEEKAYQKMVQVKRRPPTRPFTLMCGKVTDIEKYAVIDQKTRRIIDAFMPGQLTIIVRVKDDVPSFVTLGTGFIGIRISSLELVQDLINTVGKPLLVPSANKHGEAPALSGIEAFNIFKGEVSYVIDGKSISNIPSTIIKIDDKIELIREGNIPFTKILEVAGE